MSTGNVQSFANSGGGTVHSFSKERRDKLKQDGLDRSVSTDVDSITFVHLSDIHLDRQYAEVRVQVQRLCD